MTGTFEKSIKILREGDRNTPFVAICLGQQAEKLAKLVTIFNNR